ncbi:hypothetical protein F5880DRAFT_1545595 [Lentinula raphanica]|nr:hypothetical protein F5880DRAFT_1545595 [Lentinula raphanica]
MLVRSIKRRMNTPEFGHAQVRTSYYGACSNGHCYSIDQAASMEAEVRAWLNDLPAYYQLDGDINRNTTGAEPTLIAQRCEVAMTAHRLVLRVYLPFLKKHAAGVPHQASLGSVNAAHGIMKAAMALSELWKQQGSSIPSSLTPALFDFYPFSRCVFDAAVVCAHAVIKQPSTVWAATAMEDVDVALGILKGVPASRFGSGVGAAYVVSSSDCIRIVEALKSNAEGGEGSRRGASPNVPSKRKHHEVDDHRSSSPPPTPAYVYPTVSTTAISPSGQEFPQTSPSATHMQSRRQLPFAVVDKGKIDPSSTSPKGSDKDKKVKKNYPVVGVRKRAPKDNLPFAQVPVVQPPNMISNTSTTLPGSRRQSVSTPVAEKPNPVSVSGRTMYPTSHQPTSAATQPPPFQSPNIPQLQAAAAQEQFAYRSRSSSLSQDPRLHMQRPRRDSTLSTSTDYPMATHAPPEDEHAVLSASSGSPQNTISSEMHLGSSISSRQHNVQQAYVESPTSYDTPLDQNASFEYPFHQQSAVEAFNNTRSSSLNAAPDAYPSSSNSYGTASSSGGAMPTSSPGSSYTNPASTVAYSPQTHQTNSSSFNQKNNAPQSRGYYDTTGMYENYNNPSGAGQAGIMHGDMVQSVISGTMDDSMMFDQVSYDIKPSMEELNDQHRQHTYQAYNSDHRSQSQLHNAVSSSQVWTTLPQTGHVPDGATSYWSDTSIPPDNRPFYQT